MSRRRTIAATALATLSLISICLPAWAVPIPRRDVAASSTGGSDVQDALQRQQRGYVINRYGFGNYVRGPDGSFGGYPAGSVGAQELQNEQRYKCRDYPESC